MDRLLTCVRPRSKNWVTPYLVAPCYISHISGGEHRSNFTLFCLLFCSLAALETSGNWRGRIDVFLSNQLLRPARFSCPHLPLSRPPITAP